MLILPLGGVMPWPQCWAGRRALCCVDVGPTGGQNVGPGVGLDGELDGVPSMLVQVVGQMVSQMVS
jgi:hypothetical protein